MASSTLPRQSNNSNNNNNNNNKNNNISPLLFPYGEMADGLAESVGTTTRTMDSPVIARTRITTMADAAGERRKRAASSTLPRQSKNSNNNNNNSPNSPNPPIITGA